MTDYERALARELAAVGISGRLRRRILDEIADHLGCDPEAGLGDPRSVAGEFADVVGTSRAKTAALAAFASLVVAGLLFGVAFLAAPHGLLRSAQRAGGAGGVGIPMVAALVAAVAVQVAVAAGGLSALRWLWRRDCGVLPAAEAAILLRRAGVAVAAGIVSMVSLGVISVGARPQLGAGAGDVGLVAAGLGVGALVAAIPSLWAASRVRPTAAGEAGDVLADLGPLAPDRLRGRPWRIAVLMAVGVAGIITLAAVPAQDVYDGAARGILDGMACLVGFATLGRYLGLWGAGQAGGSEPS